ASAHSYAATIKQCRDVMGMHARYLESGEGAFVRRQPEKPHAVDIRKLLGHMGEECRLMRRYSGPVEGSQIVECGAKPDRLDDGRRPRLETVRRIIIGDLIFRHGFDHLAAALIGPHAFQMFILSEEKADPRGTIELVARADVKVAIKRLNVDGLMHRTLTAVDENLSARGMCEPDDLRKWGYGAKHIGHMRHGHKLRPRREELGKSRNVECIIRIQSSPSQHHAIPLAQKMPRHDVGMMLHFGEDDLIALIERGS